MSAFVDTQRLTTSREIFRQSRSHNQENPDTDAIREWHRTRNEETHGSSDRLRECAAKKTQGVQMCLGIPGRIVELRDDAGFPMGTVDFGGVKREVCLSYVRNDVDLGDYVIVHVGFAISKVDEAEAKRTFEALREMSLLDELDWIGEVADASLTAELNRPAVRGIT